MGPFVSSSESQIQVNEEKRACDELKGQTNQDTGHSETNREGVAHRLHLGCNFNHVIVVVVSKNRQRFGP